MSTKEQLEEYLDVLEVDQKKLILHNDNHNTFEWVIECLIDICSYSAMQAEQTSFIVHFKGKSTVKEGLLEKLRPMKDALADRGLSVTIE